MPEIVKWGNSLAIRIPKVLAERAGVREGDPVVVEAEEGRIHVRRSRPRVPTLRELVAQISARNRYPAIASGADRGKEKVEW